MDPFFTTAFKIILTVGTFLTIIIIYYLHTKNKERISMIENGTSDPEDVRVKQYFKLINLRNGIFLISFGFGFLIAGIIDHFFLDDLIFFPIYISSVLLSGGAGFLIYYKILNKLT